MYVILGKTELSQLAREMCARKQTPDPRYIDTILSCGKAPFDLLLVQFYQLSRINSVISRYTTYGQLNATRNYNIIRPVFRFLLCHNEK